MRNDRAAAEVGLEGLSEQAWLDHFARFLPLPENLPSPLALRYHGHQFRQYNPDLGDGRGFLFAQLRDRSGRLLDLGTKGSGTTPWSRGGDGRLTLKGAVREVLAAELLEARGVPTCRIFSVVETGEDLVRYDEPSPTRSAVMVRLSHSHVRIGSFQRLATLNLPEQMDALLAFCARHLLPDLDSDELPLRFLQRVMDRLADCAAAWMVAGYVHGVLNTDNLNVTGESFDYGPYRWLPFADATYTAAYFDGTRLYAYGRQSGQVLWSLRRLARALGLLGDRQRLEAALQDYPRLYRQHLRRRFLERLGVGEGQPGDDAELLAAFTSFSAVTAAGWAQTFHDWRGGLSAAQRAAQSPQAELYRHAAWRPVQALFEGRSVAADLDHERLQQPFAETLGYEEIEAIWATISERDDWGPLQAKVAAIRAMGAALS